jgi:acetate kinase
MAASLGGLDVLVFTGGVGEHAAVVRRRAAERLGFLGVAVEDERNEAQTRATDREIGSSDSPVRIFVIEAREDVQIAREVRQVLV